MAGRTGVRRRAIHRAREVIRRRLLVALVVGASMSGACACGSTVGPTIGTTVSSGEGAASDPADVGRLLPSQFLAGWSRLDDAAANAGAFDLAREATHDLAPDARAALTRDGFVAGFVRVWTRDGDGAVLAIEVYEFADPQGATDYSLRTHRVPVNNRATATVSTFLVQDIPNADAAIQSVAGVTYATITYPRTRYLVVVSASGRGATMADMASASEAAARTQSVRLAG